jgi:hypothetical protein
LEGEIEELKRRLESASDRATRLEPEKRELEHQVATLSARDPWSVVFRAEDERKEGNEELTLRLLRQAVESSGPPLAQAALQLASAHLTAFAESEVVEHLVAAKHYARISRLLDPSLKGAEFTGRDQGDLRAHCCQSS